MMHHESDEQICSASYRAGTVEVTASLLARAEGMTLRYWIVLEQAGDGQTCDLGTDIMSARKLFFDVVFGGVTACTLQDVIEDRMGTLF